MEPPKIYYSTENLQGMLLEIKKNVGFQLSKPEMQSFLRIEALSISKICSAVSKVFVFFLNGFPINRKIKLGTVAVGFICAGKQATALIINQLNYLKICLFKDQANSCCELQYDTGQLSTFSDRSNNLFANLTQILEKKMREEAAIRLKRKDHNCRCSIAKELPVELICKNVYRVYSALTLGLATSLTEKILQKTPLNHLIRFTVVPKALPSIDVYVKCNEDFNTRGLLKVRYAVRLVFTDLATAPKLKYIDEVCHSMKIKTVDSSFRAERFGIWANEFKGIPHVIPVDHFKTVSERGCKKIETFSPKYTGDSGSVFGKHRSAIMSEKSLLKFLHWTSEALSELHYPQQGRPGYVHKDIKPENIVIEYEKKGYEVEEEEIEEVEIKDLALIDFETCAAINNLEHLSRFEGSQNYISPELILYHFPHDFMELRKVLQEVPTLGPKMDTWALGLMLHQHKTSRFLNVCKNLGALIRGDHEVYRLTSKMNRCQSEIQKSKIALKIEALQKRLKEKIIRCENRLIALHQTPCPSSGELDQMRWGLLRVSPEERISSKQLYEMTSGIMRKREEKEEPLGLEEEPEIPQE